MEMAVVLVSMLMLFMVMIVVIMMMIIIMSRYFNLVLTLILIFILKLLAMVVTCTRLFFKTLGCPMEHFLLDCQVTHIGGIYDFCEILFEVLLCQFDNIILLFVTLM